MGKILIVDDHPVFRRGLAALIEVGTDLSIVGEASGCADAVSFIRNHKVDLAIIDLSLREGSGLQLIKYIHSFDSSIKILVASMHDESVYAERAIRLGAHGYINKENAASEIIEAIDCILQGKIFLSEEISNRLLKSSHRQQGLNSEPRISNLTDREIEIFTLIGRGFTSKDIANKLHLSPKTVDSHREHIKLKLGIKNNVAMIQQAVSRVLCEAH